MKFKIALAVGSWLVGDGLWSVLVAEDSFTFWFAVLASCVGGLFIGLSLPRLEER